jgi:hypothetical protein
MSTMDSITTSVSFYNEFLYFVYALIRFSTSQELFALPRSFVLSLISDSLLIEYICLFCILSHIRTYGCTYYYWFENYRLLSGMMTRLYDHKEN